MLPHIMKRLINQERPDRLTVEGQLRGIPLSGKSEDAFPSGHALHVGALASAVTLLPPRYRNVIWGVGAGLVTTRIILLAHWFTDVVAGLALGISIERGLRVMTRPKSIGGNVRDRA
jgi:membrane-associated phospholipid phosphatase